MTERNRGWGRALARATYALVLLGVGWFLWNNIEEVAAAGFEVSWARLGIALALLTTSYALLVVVWTRLAALYGLHAPLPLAAKAWLLGQLGKYVPGKITVMLVRLEVYRSHPKQKVILATMVEYLAMLAASALLVLAATIGAPEIVPPVARWTALSATCVLAILLWPSALVASSNALLRLLGRPERIDQFPSYPATLAFVLVYALASSVHGLAFFVLLDAFSPLEWIHLPLVIGVYEGASLVGLAALFAPSGIGVREGVLFLALPLVTTDRATILAALLMRLVIALTEVLMSGGAVLWARTSTHSKKGDIHA